MWIAREALRLVPCMLRDVDKSVLMTRPVSIVGFVDM